jgi:adenosylcobinamide-GDP ribazoletransferase
MLGGKKMRSYLLALSFLTALPIKINYEVSKEQMGRTLAFYPVVGLTLGLIIAGVAWAGDYFHLGLAGDTLTIVVLVALTAGLHLDGLMDTFDGLLSGRPREQKLEIMKDSNVGAMGAIVLACHLLLKISFLSVLFWPDKYGLLILMPAVGRWAMVYSIANYPYARKKPGLGSIFDQETGKENLWAATVLLVAACILLTGWQGLPVLVLTGLMVHFFTKAVAKSLGGQTGDTYGAAGEMAELLFMVTAVLISSVGVSFGWMGF